MGSRRKQHSPPYAVLSSPLHFRRFDLNKSGKSIEEIAESEGVSPKSIRKSIESVTLYRTRNTHENMNQVLTSVVMRLGEKTEDALAQALASKIDIQIGNKTVKEPDHSTRLKAVSEIRQIAQVVQPKVGPSTSVSVGVGVTQQTRVASGGYIGMEDRLSQIRLQRKQQPQ